MPSDPSRNASVPNPTPRTLGVLCASAVYFFLRHVHRRGAESARATQRKLSDWSQFQKRRSSWLASSLALFRCSVLYQVLAGEHLRDARRLIKLSSLVQPTSALEINFLSIFGVGKPDGTVSNNHSGIGPTNRNRRGTAVAHQGSTR